MTQDQLDQIVQQNLDEGCAFPYLLTHCPRAIALLDELIKQGQKTHEPMGWVKLGTQGNISRSIIHIRKMNETVPTVGDHDDHWLNAVCRLMMSLELREATKEALKTAKKVDGLNDV